jgi:tetratricopeptide (TPR) repeat protein
MIDYNARLSAAILGVGVALVQNLPAQALTKVEVSKVAQSVTVMIQNAQNPQEAGSGVIIKHEGETYTVLTAHHVISQASDFKVLTPDKKMNPIVPGSIQPLPGVDLALVQFKSAGSYGVAKMGDSTQSPSGSTSFVAGFPGTNEVRNEPEYYFTSGEIAANGSRPNKDGYALAYSNPTLPGMSGGPVLNEQGELIGIHGRAEKAEKLQNSQVSNNIYVLKTEFNYAIPINTFLTLAPQVNKTLALRTPSPLVPSEPKADDFFLQADEKLNKADYKGAIADFNQVLRLNPSYDLAYTGRGVARNNLEDKKGAIEDFNQAIRINPNNMRAYASRGVIISELGDKKGAEADFKKALSLNIDPQDFRAYVNRGNARYALGDKQGAIIDYDQAIRLNPKFAPAYVNRGKTRYALGDKQGALADYDQAIRLNPKDAYAYRNRSEVREDLGDKEGAGADLVKASDLRDDLYTELGKIYSNSGNKQGAITNLDQATQQKLAVFYIERGIRHIALGDGREEVAIADLDQAVQLDRNNAEAYYWRGLARFYKDEKGAMADLNQAIRINPKYADAYEWRGRTRFELGDKKGAFADLDQVIRLKPNDSSAYFIRGRFRSESGDKKGAISDFEQVMRLNPKDSSAYIARGKVRADLGDKQGAVSDFEQVFRLRPNDYTAYFERGKVRFKLGDKKGALADFDQVMRLNPNMANDVHLERGKVRFALGDKQGAVSDLQQAVASFKSRAASDDKSLRAQGEKDYQDALKWLQRVNGR